MKTIRDDVFETNSSTCHAVTLINEDLLTRYRNCEVICIINLDLEEYETVTNIMKSNNFYDIDRFYDLIEETKDLLQYYGFSSIATNWFFSASKEEIYNAFFKGELPKGLEADTLSILGEYLFNGHNIYAYALQISDDPLKNYRGEEERVGNKIIRIEKYITV